jgi:7-carboxy-7-deazaguanine synthase
MKVCEIFASIQGESSYTGLPCVFVRMTGCNLRCSYCDTAYAYEEGIEMSEEGVVAAVLKFGLKLAEITGGEPLLQQEIFPLVTRLLDSGLTVLIETNGTVSIADIDRRAVVIMDVKTPGSGMAEGLKTGNFGLLKKNDELKFVIGSKSDYEWAVNIMSGYGLAEKCAILFSPVFNKVSLADLSAWIIRDRLPVRLNLQLHKYIYPGEQRGV